MPNVNFERKGAPQEHEDLALDSPWSSVIAMSAAELIRQVATLPPEEKSAFLKMIHEMDGCRRQAPTNGQQWPDFSKRLHQIYGDKFAPDSQSIIDEGRGNG